MTHANTRRLAPGTLVIAVADGEPGRILEVCTFRRNGQDAYSYVVQTASGREIWHADEVVLPAADGERKPKRTPKETDMTRTLTIHGQEHATAHDALVELNFSGDDAIRLGGRYFTITRAEMERLQAIGIQPTTFHHHAASGRILSVPGQHG